MEYMVEYKIKDKLLVAPLEDVSLEGLIGARCDVFIHERVSGKFAIDEVLREAEETFIFREDDKFGNQFHCLWRSEFWGKLVLSAVRVCRLKNDEKLKEDIRKSTYKVLSYQDDDGYLGTYTHKDWISFENKDWYNWNVWGRKYVLWALIESALLLDDKHILDCAEKLATHLIGQFKEQGLSVREAGVTSGLPTSSILKPMLVLYRLTGNKEYLEFSNGIVADLDREDGARPNLIRNALSGQAPARWYEHEEKWSAKAYEMMSCFDGLVEYYRVTGNERVIEATKAFWQLLYDHESNILGGVGYCEWFFDAAKYPDAATEVCDVIHWMRLCFELYKLYGDAKYMECFEKAFLNAFLAGMYENGKEGAFFVRSSGRHWEGAAQVGTKYQHCCVNNVPRGFANAAESAVAVADSAYYINLYTGSKATFGKSDIIISGGYLTTGEAVVTFRNMPVGTKVYFRIPEWSKNTVVKYGVNGYENTFNGEILPGEYLEMVLTSETESVRLRFDMTVRVCDFAHEFRHLPDNDYHVQRWIDTNGGFCDRELMVKHPMSVAYRGAVLLARSKRIGCKEEEMFDGKTVWGKDIKVSGRNVYSPKVLSANLITFDDGKNSFTYRMCDYASAANFNSEDERYFTVNI